MGTTVKEVFDEMLILIPEDFQSNMMEDYGLAERGMIEAGVALGQEYVFSGTGENRCIDVELNMAERYLASHYAYRCYLMRLKDELNQNAVNFSTLTFTIKGLEKRPEAINDSLYQLNRYLKDTVSQVTGSSSLVGFVTQFG